MVNGEGVQAVPRLWARVAAAVLELGVGLLAILGGLAAVERGRELEQAAKLWREERAVMHPFFVFLRELFYAPRVGEGVNLQVLAEIAIVFGMLLTIAALLSWWKPSVRLGIMTAVGSLCMFLAWLKVSEMSPVGGFHGIDLGFAVFTATIGGMLGGGLLVVDSYTARGRVDALVTGAINRSRRWRS